MLLIPAPERSHRPLLSIHLPDPLTKAGSNSVGPANFNEQFFCCPKLFIEFENGAEDCRVARRFRWKIPKNQCLLAGVIGRKNFSLVRGSDAMGSNCWNQGTAPVAMFSTMSLLNVHHALDLPSIITRDQVVSPISLLRLFHNIITVCRILPIQLKLPFRRRL
jgi:hypothetical protein